jgi:site-specific DNA recombinase
VSDEGGLRDAQAGQPCRSRRFLAQQREDLLWQDVCALLRHPGQMAYALERVHAGRWLPQEFQARKAAQPKERVNPDTQGDQLTDAYLAEIIPLEDYQRRRQTLEENIQAVETQIALLETQGDCQAAVIGLMTSIAAFCQRVYTRLDRATFAAKRQLIELLKGRVIVSDEAVEFRYVMPTHPASEPVRFFNYVKTISMMLLRSLTERPSILALYCLSMNRLSVSSFRPPCCPPAASVLTSIAATYHANEN